MKKVLPKSMEQFLADLTEKSATPDILQTIFAGRND